MNVFGINFIYKQDYDNQMKLICNPSFPDGMVILSKDLYKKYIGNLDFNSKCIFMNNNLPPETVIVNTNAFNNLKENKYARRCLCLLWLWLEIISEAYQAWSISL